VNSPPLNRNISDELLFFFTLRLLKMM